MLKRKPIKRRVTKNPTKLKVKDLLGDKVTVTHKYGMVYGKLTLDKDVNEFNVTVGTGGLDGVGFVTFINSDVKSITNDNNDIGYGNIVLK